MLKSNINKKNAFEEKIPLRSFAFIWIFVLLSSLEVFSVAAYGSIHNNPNEKIDLLITIDQQNDLSGEISIKFDTQPKNITTSYTIVPFIISNLTTDNSNVQASFSVDSEGYSIINMIALSTTPNGSKINFKIIPHIANTKDLDNKGLDAAPNTLIIETTNTSENTFDFRFDPQSFGNLTNFTGAMIIPSQIQVIFPDNTIFTTKAPTYRSSNISDSGQVANTFSTNVGFYKNQHLWINYAIPPAFPAIDVVINIIILSLSPLGIGILAFPEEIIKKKLRLQLALIAAMAAIILFFVNFIHEGTDYVLGNLSSLIPAAILYLLTLVVLTFHILSPLKQFITAHSPQGNTNQPSPQGNTNQPSPQGNTNQPSPQGNTNQPSPQGNTNQPSPS